MPYFFTSESVSEGHPDKVADQISDALLDEFLKQDSESKVACETLVTTGLVVLSGEVNTNAWVDQRNVARKVINDIGYTKNSYMFDGDSCGVISAIHEQSQDIRRGVERQSVEEQGAGDQGMMFGYAVREADNFMPFSIELAHYFLQVLAEIRREQKEMLYLAPDSKSQITVEYDDDGTPKRVHTVVVSTQHDDFIKPKDDSVEAQLQADRDMLEIIRNDVKNILVPRVKKELPERLSNFFNDDFILFVNPTGKFVIGGPHGDTGLTGRKIIVDTYGGKGAHGGGAFSGKDPSKVDRSAAYAMRHIAKNAVAAGIADEILVQVAYAIGVAEPVGFYVNTYGTSKVNIADSEIAVRLQKIFDMRPGAIIKKYKLKNPIYLATASYGHFGRDFYTKEVKFMENGKEVSKEVEFFTWEKLDAVDMIKKEFSM
ncbi:MAG: methionine adenosyltransferase [Bacteroidales bacterium]|nr:methionine adenosyltransferase [Bacteroidales bacterium]